MPILPIDQSRLSAQPDPAPQPILAAQHMQPTERPDPDFPQPGPQFGWRSILRTVLRLLTIALIAWTMHLLITWAIENTETMQATTQMPKVILVLLLLAYAVMIAMPFVPGIEIGLSLMLLQGGVVAPWVYLATLMGLMLAFCMGAKVPYRIMHQILFDLHLTRACKLIEKIEPLDSAARLALLQQRLPARIAPFAIRNRNLVLALLINMPGNSVIGGGGGIMLFAGMSRLFKTTTTALTMAVAVAPVPILMWLFDIKLIG
ncbi:MAG: hypothetical protein U1D35_14540 [Paracoccaceae bacterium]|nr:hypothetical protein [Paracoccaceae bacterium]